MPATSRKQFLRTLGATSAAGALLTACGRAGQKRPAARDAPKRMSGGDAAILNFALTLEYLEAAFYERALSKGKGLSPDTRALALELHDNERAHVDALRTAIKGSGGTPVAAPEVGFGLAFTSEARFLKLAQSLEDTGVSAYNGAAPSLRSAQLVGAAGGIVQVEARHASLIRLQGGLLPTPDAFDKALGRDEAAAVRPFMR